MLRVGLSGGVGAGKSTVATRLVELGAVLIDADVLARECVAPGSDGFAAVVAEFGESIRAPDGSLDRPALAALVFADPARRQALERITHPLIATRTAELLSVAPADAVVVHDVPLLVEKRMGSGYHLVVVVDASEDVRVARLVAQRGMSEDDARARVRAQATDAERRAAADVWLDNRGSADDVRSAVDRLWTEHLRPFEENLRLRRPAPRPQRALLVPADASWARQAERVLGRVRTAAGDRVLRYDHIGSTSVPSLEAKDVLDFQVVVADAPSAAAVADDLLAAGLVRRAGHWWDVSSDGKQWDKVMSTEADPTRAVNCHVRPVQSPAWREALLLRDWLRATPEAASEYVRLKRRLAAEPHESVQDYADRKTPWIRAALERAGAWAGRSPGVP